MEGFFDATPMFNLCWKMVFLVNERFFDATPMFIFPIFKLAAGVDLLLAAAEMKLNSYFKQQNIENLVGLPGLFLLFLISSFAETSRLPFDLAEAETELIAGFHVELAGIGFTLFFLAEYANIVGVSLLTTTLFAGGWCWKSRSRHCAEVKQLCGIIDLNWDWAVCRLRCINYHFFCRFPQRCY